MEKDTKERLDILVLRLQKVVVGNINRGGAYGAYSAPYSEVIREVNMAFGTNYENVNWKLREYFKEKPCERSR